MQASDTKRLPMMPIRDVVIFPHLMIPFVVGRISSVQALQAALAGDKTVFLATQRDASIDQPAADEIYSAGTIVNIIQSLVLPDGNIKVLVVGVERARTISVASDEGFFRATVQTAGVKLEREPKMVALADRVRLLLEQYLNLNRNLNREMMIAVTRLDEPGRLADTVGANLPLTVQEKQALLEIFDPLEQLTRVAGILEGEIEKSSGKAIHQEVDFPVDPAQIYEILLDAAKFSAFTGHPAKMQARPGGAFKLFGGLIEGRNVELVENQRIVQAWRSAQWPAGVYSIVRFELVARDSGTRLVLDHTGFAEEHWDHLSAGWQSNYWDPMRKYLKA